MGPFGIQATIVHPGDLDTEFGRYRIVARDAGPGSPYRAIFEKMLRFYAEQENAGPSPDALATTIERRVWRSRLAARVIHGSPLERLGVISKAFLPGRIFETVMRMAYSSR